MMLHRLLAFTIILSVSPLMAQDKLRIATFNVSLYGKSASEIRDRLASKDDAQAQNIARIVQTVRPDILLINELDYDQDSVVASRLATNYFAIGQTDTNGESLEGIDYPYFFSAPSNTGIDSELDLNNDGKRHSPNDAFGYGIYPGQYSMTVFSRFPIKRSELRTFQNFAWSQMPGAIRPVVPSTGDFYYDDATWSKLRLSSKNHIDVPVQVGDTTIHILASHPTPPVFDGREDRNGARNHDEVQFWVNYLQDDTESKGWLVDDAGQTGGLSEQARFVVMGDLNADPIDGSGRREAIQSLIAHPRVNDVEPKSTDDAINDRQSKFKGKGDLATKTADWGRNGFMRVDYVLPSSNLNVIDSGVFWPASSDAKSKWASASDHRMVWIEVSKP
ncbi:endonuclease/exonuclease/phosphatase family protein [Stieleria sp. JC731]|uniref:endonuclease/exonuclease/phosphatase family protein n=1 Tax=Pirellulaceae TaxID=2691357 RepID=UPI001E38A650|nr:endonuclease/exonuclease/phosphatase family protein [Stieleria sp. JC731]MCC9600646.1 endonuclease/exonuclease/phosphatase family protein [Stieleria sp. JC731]